MKKKLIATVMAATMAVTALTGCGSSSASSAKKDIKVPTKPFGDTVKYDPSVEINDGKDISIDMWEWGSDELFQKIIDRYTAIHPNVTINLVDNPWEDYWTKLPLALDGENGPALFNVHNSYHENLINYMAPLDIPVEDLEQDFNGVNAHVIDGKVYYIDYGMMTGSVYYNKEMWKEAGLTDDDIPKTWDEMIEVAKKLTIKDGDNIVQAGLNFNNDFNQNYLLGLNYQLGENLFKEDGKTPNVNSDAMKKVMQMLVDMYDKDQIGSKDFVKFFLCDDESQVDFNLAMSTFPAKKSLADNEEILKNPSLKVLAEHIDHYIWPGPMPSCVEEDMKKAGEDIFYNGVDINTALDKAQADIIKDMKNSSFQSVENLYEFAK